MKIFIVGSQGTMKSDVYNLFKEDKFHCGKLFTNYSESEATYNNYLYKYFPHNVVEEIYEQDAYVFICNAGYDPEGIYTGLDFDEYQNNDIFVATPEQFVNIKPEYLKDSLILWLDGDRTWRFNNIRYKDSTEPTYNIYNIDEVENSISKTFYKYIRKIQSDYKNVLYFYDENPGRVEVIAKTIFRDPKLMREFITKFDDKL